MKEKVMQTLINVVHLKMQWETIIDWGISIIFALAFFSGTQNTLTSIFIYINMFILNFDVKCMQYNHYCRIEHLKKM